MNDEVARAWRYYCDTTWPAIAKDFWEELTEAEKNRCLKATRSVREINQDYWT